jgi:6-phosphogluconolactonase
VTDRDSGELLVFATPQDVAREVADAFVHDARDAIAARGAFSVALAGGTTPKAAYMLLAQEPAHSAVDWSKVRIFFGDERCVPPDNAESNYKMAADAMLNAVGIPAGNVYRMRGEIDPQTAAAEYASLLREKLGEPPRFDLIMLGMGADGHTASLFPGSDPHQDEAQLVRAPYVEKMHAHRITLTPLVLNNARHIIVATEGLTKAPALYAVRKGPYDPKVHPIQVLAPVDGSLTWCVDRAAAAQLT